MDTSPQRRSLIEARSPEPPARWPGGPVARWLFQCGGNFMTPENNGELSREPPSDKPVLRSVNLAPVMLKDTHK